MTEISDINSEWNNIYKQLRVKSLPASPELFSKHFSSFLDFLVRIRRQSGEGRLQWDWDNIVSSRDLVTASW